MQKFTEVKRQKNCGYEESKPSPQDWDDMLEDDPEFYWLFKRVFNDADIPESDCFTPKVI